ncbi:hypothetical protein AAFC00_003123 [Neodothiora populina]|uniref:Protein phosphatase 4 core regulatory subunit R2 n=1 Tax=Neodothiora populina TaxID=2781224 RepID=A0ABR3P9M2_9PEZI
MSVMESSEDILEQAARDGSIDISEWPRVLENVLQRLHNIVHNDFPIPQVPASASAAAPAPASSIAPATATATTTHAAPVDLTVAAAASPQTSQSSDPSVPSSSQTQTDGSTDDAATAAAAATEPEPSSQTSATTNKENAPPVRPPVPSFSGTANTPAPSTSVVEMEHTPLPDSSLPPDLLSSYQSSVNILRTTFSQSPPYTVQRLAELVLQPRRHYRYLPPFLSALDRAVSVTSTVNEFPIPVVQTSGAVKFFTNGDSTNGVGDRAGLGSDESLGGALLTPIPWIKRQEDDENAHMALADPTNTNQELRTEDEETIDGPHGAGRVETVSVTTNSLQNNPTHAQAPTGDGDGSEGVQAHEQELRSQGAVTQGELLRQEQEAGVVPDGGEPIRRTLLAGAGAAAVGRDADSALTQSENGVDAASTGSTGADERPHARGPDLIGMEDTGPQTPSAAGRPLDMEAAAGKKESPHSTSPIAESEQQAHETASIVDKEQGDATVVQGNEGGASDTAVAEDAAAALERKRKRTGGEEEDGKADDSEKEKKLEMADDDEMTDVTF